MDHVPRTKMLRQLQSMSKVPLALGDETKLVPSGGRLQLLWKTVMASRMYCKDHGDEEGTRDNFCV